MKKRKIRVVKHERKPLIVAIVICCVVFISLTLRMVGVANEKISITEQENERISTTLALMGVYKAGDILDCNNTVIMSSNEENTMSYENADIAAAFQDLMGGDIVESSMSDKCLLANLAPDLYGYYDSRLYDLDFNERIGNSVTLCIDQNIQKQCLRYLTGMADFDYSGASLILMNYETGEIYAAVGSEDSQEDWTAKAFTTYCPGSLIKPIIASAALSIDPSFQTMTYDCGDEDTHNFGNNIIMCSGNASHGTVDMSLGLAKSCNAYFINLGRNLDNDKLKAVTKSYGLDTETSFPYIHFYDGTFQPKHINDDMKNLTYIGQGTCEISPIQLCSIYSTFFNGGKMTQPKFVNSITNPKTGETIYQETFSTEVLSSEVADTVLGMMQKVNKEGTGTGYDDPMLSLASKTGTSENGDSNNISCIEGLTDGKYLCFVSYTNVDPSISSARAGQVATAVLQMMCQYQNTSGQ